MKKHAIIMLYVVLFSFFPCCVYAGSPIPTFDKEAVTDYPYMRTGSQDIEVKTLEIQAPGLYRKGNTGSEADPAFYVKEIKLTGYPVIDDKGELKNILSSYSGRSVKVAELPLLTNAVTNYCRGLGYTVPLAVIPKQEIIGGVLEVKIYAASYGGAEITVNSSDVYMKTLESYLRPLRKGGVITDRRLETVINNLNDLPGVTARAILRPGDSPGTTAVDIEVQKRKVWNNYIFADNGGGHYSGSYRFGFNTEINNPTRIGDKLIVSGTITDEDTKNYSLRYEIPVGYGGTRVGAAYSQVNYELSSNPFYDTIGKSRGFSIYGVTPLYRDKADRITLIYGYDRRDITDDYRFNKEEFRHYSFSADKTANVWHAGISGSRYAPSQFLQYDLIYWYGDIRTDGGAYYDGSYHKLTADILKIWYSGRFNYRIKAKGQLASRALDSSEQFFVGGINGVRAYASGDGYGDSAYTATGEIRYSLGAPGLEFAAFIDAGAAKNLATGATDHLAGWGLGLRYAKQNEWYAQFDFAQKIDGRPDRSKPGNSDYRIWFQIYRMF